MSGARTTSVPTLHLFAELAAYPFASEIAFRSGLTDFCTRLSGDTGDLWRQVENELILRSFPLSVDEISDLRDFVWFTDRQGTVALEEVLRTLPKRCFRIEGATVRPRLPKEIETPDTSGADARQFWQWMSLALPPDLLIAASDGPPPCRSVAFVSPRLDRQLIDKGFAQVHLHFGAASEFADLWVGAQLMLAHTDIQSELFRSPGAVFDEGRELDDWLARAALVRFLLAAFLADGAREGFDTWLCRCVFPLLSATSGALLQAALREVACGRRDRGTGITCAEVRTLFTRLSGATVRKQPKRAGEIQRLDPIARFFPAGDSPLVPTPEMQLVAEGLRYLERNRDKKSLPFAPPFWQRNQESLPFAQLFWQMVRLRCLFYRHLVQRPMTKGLQWFFRFYNRLRSARAWGTAVQIESAGRLEGIGHGLKYLELRTAPDESVAENRKLLLATEKAAQWLRAGDPDLEIGLVLHFIRDRGGASKEGKFGNRWAESHANPAYLGAGWRYSVLYQQRRRQARALALMIQRYPHCLHLLRGLDICTDEAGVPPWVLLPLFQHVHAAAREASSYLQQVHGQSVPALRSTVHAGEDFTHLLTGLRHVTETMQHFPLGEGDRLGHAIALGLDPLQWATRTGSVMMPKEERLFDLVWEWGWYAWNRVDPPDGRRCAFLQREINRLSRAVFGKPQAPEVLEMMVDQLHSPSILCSTGFPTSRRYRYVETPQNEEEKEEKDRCLDLLISFLTDPEVFRNGRELEWVRTEPDGESLAAIQEKLLVHVGARGVVVEANPSSNLLVGDLRDLEGHPLWRMSPPRSGPTPPISVCLGSDDPVTFATTLREDYQRLVDSMVLSGLSQEEAERWLDCVREQGRTSRFTLPHVDVTTHLQARPRRWFQEVTPPP